jgi:hypothetical protein
MHSWYSQRADAIRAASHAGLLPVIAVNRSDVRDKLFAVIDPSHFAYGSFESGWIYGSYHLIAIRPSNFHRA